jgi:dTDP-4-dehydrorhamnose 3,5-epimerase
MQIIKTPIEGLVEIEPRVFEDARGHFFESYNADAFAAAGIPDVFVQDNQSLSQRGVLRGLHFQAPPFAQGKLVRVIKGSVWDVAVDIRKDSPTYGQYHGVHLSEENKKMFWIPPGFAHGFVTLEDGTIFAYKCTNVYNKESEGAVRWNDADLQIEWPIQDFASEVITSEKDDEAPSFADLQTPFKF